MSSQPPKPTPSDPNADWPLPGDAEGGSESGSWEHEDAEAAGPAPAGPAPADPDAPGDGPAEAVVGPLRALWSDPRSRPLLLLSLAAVGFVCVLACFVVALAVLSNRPAETSPRPAGGAAEASRPVTSSISLSVLVAGTPAPTPASGVPTRLQVAGKAFTVSPLQLAANNEWTYDRNAQRAVFWAVGTVVNYVIGLPNSNENRASFEALKTGDLLVLDTGAGQFRYRVVQQTSYKTDDPSPLRDRATPQITLLLLGDTASPNQRRAVIARYTDEGSPNVLAAVGAPVNLVDARVRATNPRALEGARVGLPAGRNYYQVDLEITNLLTRTLDTAQFVVELQDGAGARYPLSSPASYASGGKGWASGALAAGATVTVTAGFDVPAAMPGPKVEVDFSADPSNAFVARYAIPYRAVAVAPTAAPTAVPVADVDLLAVSLSPEGNEVRIVGQIRNLTTRELAASPRDVSLTGNGSPVALNAALPGFPWTIPAGESLAFQLNFVRPPAGNVVFTLFGRSYQIDGL